MLANESKDVRVQAVEIKYNMRNSMKNFNEHEATEPRKFIVPKINFKAENIYHLIDLTSTTLTEPPLTKELTNTELLDAINIPLVFPAYPCDNQAVEHWVKEVTDASKKRSGHFDRHDVS